MDKKIKPFLHHLEGNAVLLIPFAWHRYNISPPDRGRAGKQSQAGLCVPWQWGWREMPEKTYQKLVNKETVDRWKYAIELSKFGQPAVDHLVKALSDEDKWVRYLAVDALATIKDKKAVDSLVKVLKDQDQDVRFAAADALGRLGDARAEAGLKECLATDNCYVKIAVEEALERLKK
jgi:HEAT repeat protein